MSSIDPLARVAAGAAIGQNVTIGPFCTIGPNVVIGDGCRLVSHVNVTGHTTIGPRTVVYPFASLGTPPQSFGYRGGPTKLVIGADCDIREHVTMNTGTEDGGGITQVGDGGFFMVASHVGHDCKVGSKVVFANNATLGGHVEVGDYAVFGGAANVRQHVRIGQGAMVAGVSAVRGDVIPFATAHGSLATLVGLNVVGMRRRGLSKSDILRVRRAYRALFFGPGEFRTRLEQVAADYAGDPLVGQIVDFIRAGKRPLTIPSKRNEADADS
jgi:UDP-N-acetylglucosamine acyltransferase